MGSAGGILGWNAQPDTSQPNSEGDHPEERLPTGSSPAVLVDTNEDSAAGSPATFKDNVASLATLEASKKRRKKDAKYSCSLCSQRFTSRDNRINHEDAHNGIKRYSCNYCTTRFRTRSVLKRHQKSTRCLGPTQQWKSSHPRRT